MTGLEPGIEVGRGMRSTVHVWGRDTIVKLPFPDTPDEWTEYEFRYARSAFVAGVPAAEHREIVEVDGRLCAVATRIWGSSMLELLVTQPELANPLAVQLAELQRELFTAVPSLEFPRQNDRLSCKLRRAGHKYELDTRSLVAFVNHSADQADRFVLCHGDVHPRNVLIAADGPILVDWFDACRGLPIAEIARTSILLESAGSIAIGSDSITVDAETFAEFGRTYRSHIVDALSINADELAQWVLVQRVARLAEGFEPDGIDELRGALTSL